MLLQRDKCLHTIGMVKVVIETEHGRLKWIVFRKRHGSLGIRG